MIIEIKIPFDCEILVSLIAFILEKKIVNFGFKVLITVCPSVCGRLLHE